MGSLVPLSVPGSGDKYIKVSLYRMDPDHPEYMLLPFLTPLISTIGDNVLYSIINGGYVQRVTEQGVECWALRVKLVINKTEATSGPPPPTPSTATPPPRPRPTTTKGVTTYVKPGSVPATAKRPLAPPPMVYDLPPSPLGRTPRICLCAVCREEYGT